PARPVFRADRPAKPGNRLGTEFSKANLHGHDIGDSFELIKSGMLKGPDPRRRRLDIPVRDVRITKCHRLLAVTQQL
ncbi:MAG: hypothetical protein OXC26_22830, partial [Albidovulum sp.]|nr:hypothetical protein [Albidovulum sp.]